jgi:hypothetical protein
VYLFGQKRSDMGLNWSILTVVLGLQGILPKLAEFRDGFLKISQILINLKNYFFSKFIFFRNRLIKITLGNYFQ